MQPQQSEPVPEAPKEQTNLDRKYGRIGISAVVAALRYQGSAAMRSRSQHLRQPDLGAAEEPA